MGKGHSDRKKINDLVLKGKYKEAREALSTSKKRINKRGQKALSSKAASALEKHLENQIRLRRSMKAKGYSKMISSRSKAIKEGMKKSPKDIKRRTKKSRMELAKKIETRREMRRLPEFNRGG